ncbi:MAG: recombination regulator RecX [Oscillospiraceae bacterium]|nr:recombination regulator RecX [Oscillospiraceae bacterium]
MTIESVEKKSEKSSIYIIYFDDGTEMSMNANQLGLHGIHEGKEFTQEEYAHFRIEVELGESKAKALQTLGSRQLSSREIQKRLISKGYSPEIAEMTSDWLNDIGLINDEEYGKSIARHYAQKGYGQARIRQELFKRGIERELWEQSLEEIEGSEDAVFTFIERKLRTGDSEKDIERITAALVRRGYSYSEAKETLRRYFDENED